MENEIICKAEIKPKEHFIATILAIVYWIIFICAPFILGSASYSNSHYEQKSIWIFIYFYKDNYSYNEHSYDYSEYIPLFLFIALFIAALPVLFYFGAREIAKRCNLILTDKGIFGNLKKALSKKELNLPIDKIDNIMISENIIDKLRGGKTIAVRTTNGLIKFNWVQNADEFVNATLAKIEEYKQSVKENVSVMAHNASGGSDNSAAAKIKELKELLDSGLISQEEFEAKRKELIDKM